MAKLVQINGNAVGTEYPLGELCIIGRSPNVHVRLHDRTVSRQHAKITRLGDGYVIEDLESGRGTLVNGLNITASRLRAGDEISVVNTTFRFEDTALTTVATSEFSLAFEAMDEEKRRQAEGARGGRNVPPTGEVPVMPAPDTALSGHQRSDILLSVGRLVTTATDTDTVLRQTMECCLDLFPVAHRALVAVPNHATRKLEVRALILRDGVERQRFHLSRAITGQVLGRGRPTLAMEAQEDPSGGDPMEVTMIAAPLEAQGKKLGLIYVDHLGGGQTFAEEDLAALSFVAGQLAMTLLLDQLRSSVALQSRTEKDLSAAREVQKRFLPRGVPKVPGFHFVAHYDPCRNVGGDLYDFIPLDARRIGVVIGDVAGKGFAAALVMAWVTSQLRVAAHQEMRPADVVARINYSLNEARQDDVFVTLFYGVLDRLSMKLNFCNAGHMPPLVRRVQGDRLETIEDGTGLPVGLVPEAQFEEGQINLQKGDTVLLFSDGVTEAQNADGRMFGMDRLVQSVSEGSAKASDMVSDLLRELRGFVGQQPQSDDITIVALGAGTGMEDIRTTLPPGTSLTGLM